VSFAHRSAELLTPAGAGGPSTPFVGLSGLSETSLCIGQIAEAYGTHGRLMVMGNHARVRGVTILLGTTASSSDSSLYLILALYPTMLCLLLTSVTLLSIFLNGASGLPSGSLDLDSRSRTSDQSAIIFDSPAFWNPSKPH
jgi:hypothetical protein